MRDEILRAEASLRQAMLESDVEALDRLVHDRLLFAGPDGAVYRKEDDLRVHRSKVQTDARRHAVVVKSGAQVGGRF